MKKLLLLLLVASSLQAQQAQEKADEVVIGHMNYKTTFSKHHRYPTHVEWWVTRAKLECKNPVSRTDKFLPDPQLRKDSDIDDDYVKSGFDRGHLSPAADARCNITHMAESFYFTNMAPQYPGLNRGQWKNHLKYMKLHQIAFVNCVSVHEKNTTGSCTCFIICSI